MTIKLKPEQERIIQAEIESGHFRSPAGGAYIVL
jgi:Arc/MetJ-type ribon-helix-helix transcriptional regulator